MERTRRDLGEWWFTPGLDSIRQDPDAGPSELSTVFPTLLSG